MWYAISLRCVLNENININEKLAIICPLCGQKSGAIGQNRENRHQIKFGAQFPSTHDTYDRMYQITLLYSRKSQHIAILLLFPEKIEI